MKNLISKFINRSNPLFRDQRGITGLETAIVLIAFVVVSSVFAFAALSTGLFTTDKAKETIHAGLSEARGTMELKGSVVADATAAGTGVVEEIVFHVSNAAAGEPIDLSQGNTIIRYTDKSQTANLNTTTEFSISDMGTGDGDDLLERGEVFEIKILNMDNPWTGSDMSVDLGTDTKFTLEVIPPKGAVLYIQRITPVSFELFTLLN